MIFIRLNSGSTRLNPANVGPSSWTTGAFTHSLGQGAQVCTRSRPAPAPISAQERRWGTREAQ